MSGFVGVVRFDEGPVDEGLFRILSTRIDYRGPDGAGQWKTSRAMFARTLLVNGPEAARDHQPLTKGPLVIIADSRLDDRTGLARSLGCSRESTDGELIAAAYEKWGDDCAKRFVGDFSIAIWDSNRQRLFCTRDRFGLRSFFYGRVAGSLVITNDLHAILGVPELSSRLNEDAIADFLLFGGNHDARRTTFAEIHRLPAAHAMTTDAAGVKEWRYWTIPTPERPRSITEDEAVAGFREIFLAAVGDRIRAGRAVISMSGGMDSTAVAATARQWSIRTDTQTRLVAMTSVAHDTRPDDEQPFAELTARDLDLELVLDPSTNETPFDGWSDERHRGLEPGDDPFNAATVRFFHSAASYGPTVLTGHGGDAVLYSSHQYFYDLLRHWQWGRFASEALGFAITRRRRPPLCLRSRFRKSEKRPEFPRWIDDDFAGRTEARERWRGHFEQETEDGHPFRPEAFRHTTNIMWPNLFEGFDAAATGAPVEHSAPYFDTRVIEYLFSLPAMPHFADKDLLRRSMRGWLPEEVRLRRKTPFAADCFASRAARVAAATTAIVRGGPGADRFVRRSILCEEIASNGEGYARHQQAIAASLTRWLTARGYA